MCNCVQFGVFPARVFERIEYARHEKRWVNYCLANYTQSCDAHKSEGESNRSGELQE